MAIDLYNLILTAKIQKGGGGGGDIDVDALNVTENGTYTASSGHAFSPVSVNVPIPSGYIQPTGTSSITANGIYDITSFASVDVNVSGGGGDHDAEDGIVERSISQYTNSRVSTIGSWAFNNYTLLEEVAFPNVVSVYSSAFAGCINLSSASLPNVKYVGSSAFGRCSKLTEINFPTLESADGYAFSSCGSVSIAELPSLKSVAGHTFRDCAVLHTVRLSAASLIMSSAFNGLKSLMSVYILSTSVAVLGATNAFLSTPMSNSTYTGAFGSIYVPASLVSAYKTASVWSAYSSRITSYVE